MEKIIIANLSNINNSKLSANNNQIIDSGENKNNSIINNSSIKNSQVNNDNIKLEQNQNNKNKLDNKKTYNPFELKREYSRDERNFEKDDKKLDENFFKSESHFYPNNDVKESVDVNEQKKSINEQIEYDPKKDI